MDMDTLSQTLTQAGMIIAALPICALALQLAAAVARDLTSLEICAHSARIDGIAALATFTPADLALLDSLTISTVARRWERPASASELALVEPPARVGGLQYWSAPR